MVTEKTESAPAAAETNAKTAAPETNAKTAAPETETKNDVKEKPKPVKKETPKKENFAKPCPASKKPKPSTPVSDESKKPEVVALSEEQSKPGEDATLILSAEEEAEVAAETNEDAVKTKGADPEESSIKDAKMKKDAQKNVWVSNISRNTKAADLKKLFSDKKFKVDSAKIVTNGRSFFGYICLDTSETAQKSAKELNGIMLTGKKIVVSLSRPDLRATKASDVRRSRDQQPAKRDTRVTNGVKKGDEKVTPKKETDDQKERDDDSAKDAKDTAEDSKDDPEELERKRRRREQRYQEEINDLRTEVKRITTELQNNRRRLTDATKRLDAERERKQSMRRDIENLEGQLKQERRKHAQELEQLEKKRKVDELRYQEDRTMLNRELDECRKLREFLQRKIDDLGLARHSRVSPPVRSVERPGPIDKMHRPRMEPRGGRSPPPPPKINRRSRDRSPPSSYKGKKPRLDEPSGKQIPYGNSHYQGQSSYSGGSKPLLGHYPSSGPSGGTSRNSMYGSATYPEHGRYGSGASYGSSGGYSMGNPPSLMSRPMGYPGSSSQRKY